MSDQPHSNQPQHTNSVACFRCGSKFIIEEGDNALELALQNGWKMKDTTGSLQSIVEKPVCPNCLLPKHPFNSPYFVNDDRVPPNDRGWFMDTKSEDGSTSVWKLVLEQTPGYADGPGWEFHRRIG